MFSVIPIRRFVRAAGMAIRHETAAAGRAQLLGWKQYVQLIRVLDAVGLWVEVPASEKRVIIATLTSPETSYEESQMRWTAGGFWHADGEDLGKGDVEAWLAGMAPVLADCGIDLHVETVESCERDSPGYSVAINGKTLDLYRFDPDEPGVPVTDDPWMDCSIIPSAEVNRLLKAAGSDRRVALIWPGCQDGLAVLGPEAVLRAAAPSIEPCPDGHGLVIP